MAEQQDIIDAMNEFPEWATEQTLSTIHQTLRDSKNISKASTERIVRELKKGGKSSTDMSSAVKKSNDIARQSLKADQKNADREEKARKRKQKTMRDGIYGGARASVSKLAGAEGVEDVGEAMTSVFDGIKESTNESNIAIKALGVAAGLFGTAVGQAWKIFASLLRTFTSLNEIGMGMSLSYEGLLAMTTGAKLTLEQFTEAVSRSALGVGAFGLELFTGITKNLTMANGPLRKFALTIDQAAEFAASELEMRRLTGVFGMRDQARITEAVTGNIAALTAFAKITNKSRETMLEEQKATLSRADTQAYIASLDEKARMAMSTSLKNLVWMPDQLKDMTTQMMTNMYGPRASQALQDLMQAGAVKTAGVMEEFANASRAAAKEGRSMSVEDNNRFRLRLKSAMQSEQDLMAQLGSLGNGLAQQLAGAELLEMDRQETVAEGIEAERLAYNERHKMNQLSKKQWMERSSEQAKAAAEFNAAMQDIRLAWQNLVFGMINSLGGPDGLKKVLAYVTEKALMFAGWLKDITDGNVNFWDAVEVKVGQGIDKLFKWFSDAWDRNGGFTGLLGIRGPGDWVDLAKTLVKMTPMGMAATLASDAAGSGASAVSSWWGAVTKETNDDAPKTTANGQVVDPSRDQVNETEWQKEQRLSREETEKQAKSMDKQEDILRGIYTVLSDTLIIDRKMLKKLAPDLY